MERNGSTADLCQSSSSMEPQRSSRRQYLALGAILTLALALRLAHWWAVRQQPFFQAPLYPYLLAVLYTLFGRSLDAVYLAQILLAVAGCWALYRAGREMAGGIAGEAVGLGAALLAAIYGPFFFYDAQLLKESPAVAVTSFLLWALAAARARGGTRRWLGAGALLGILALLRENALLLVPFLLPLAWIRDGKVPGLLRQGGAFVA